MLEVRQDITASVQRSQRDLLLLIAVAGASMLFTSALLRLVIWRGLLQPLRGFTRELEQLEADSLGVQSWIRPATMNLPNGGLQPAANTTRCGMAAERRFVDGIAHGAHADH